MARIWGRTNCNFDSSGRGRCETGDCNGGLQCTGWGQPPNTLAEYALNQYNNLDFYDISLVDGFNIPMSLGKKITVYNLFPNKLELPPHTMQCGHKRPVPERIEPRAVATTRAQFIRRTSTAVQTGKVHVAALGSQDSSNRGAPTPTAIHKTTRQALSLVVPLTTGSCFVLRR
ncbi:unnamed protein product [Arabidopsis lyrata]|nr:unnamed protein product [Arabidopsis lyrata]